PPGRPPATGLTQVGGRPGTGRTAEGNGQAAPLEHLHQAGLPEPNRRRRPGSQPAAAVGPSDTHRRLSPSGRLQPLLVHVATAPVFTRFERLDDRVTGSAEVLRRVLVLRIVTAADVPAGQAETQVDPRVSYRQALLTALRSGLHVADLVQVGTGD